MTLTDEHSPSARRPRLWLIVVAILAVAGLAVWAATAATSPAGPGSSPGSAADAVQGLDAAAVDSASLSSVQAQQSALRRGDRRAFLQTWAADARSQRTARWIFANTERMGVTPTLRWVESEQTSTGVGTGGSWHAAIDAAWRIPGIDRSAATTQLTYTFVRVGDAGARVAGVQVAPGQRMPIWLVEPLHVRRGPGWLVAASTASRANELRGEIPSGLRQVRDVVGADSAGVAVYAPSSADALEKVAAAPAGQFDGIAAVTISADGSTRPTSPVAVMLNPTVFDRLRTQGRTVVLVHEMTHAVTGAATVDMPLWLAEGFADYVGIEAARVPVETSAGLALRKAERVGLPTRLPSQADFTRTGAQLEVAYEQSWLAVRSIARHQGAAALLDFYRQSVAEPAQVRATARTELGISLREVTQQWRADLRRLADG